MPEALLSSVGFIPVGLHIANSKASRKVCNPCNAPTFNEAHNANMSQNHLKAWREHAGLSQDELAGKLDTTKGVISLLESGKRGLSDKWLRRLAEVLNTRPGHILDIDPNEIDNDLLDIWVKLNDTDRDQAVRILRTFLKTGTDEK